MSAGGSPRSVRAVDVLVVGGGPAGSSTAAWAARAGLRVLLVERARFPREKPCAEYLSPEAARDLDDLGVRDKVEASAARLAGFRLVADDGTAAVGRYDGAAPFVPYRPFGYALSRAVLDGIVLDAARDSGAEVVEGAALTGLEFAGSRVAGGTVRMANSVERVRAGVVVGADGLNSLVARRLGLARRGRLRRLAVVAHLSGVRDVTDVGELYAGRGRYLGMAQLGEDRVNAAAVVPLSDAPALADGSSRFLRSELARYPGLAERTAGARIVRRPLVAGPFARSSSRVVADGALLVGDAADFYDPFTGEGIFAALRGGRLAAAAIAEALARGAATARALRPYVRARRREFADKWFLERLVAHGATVPAVMRRFVRAISRRPDVAGLWVGAAGDSVPVRALFAPRRLAALVMG